MAEKTATIIERRFCPLVLEMRHDPSVMVGHGAVFNQVSEEIWGFREIIKPGAFTKTIQEGDVRALFNHDVNYVLGRTKSGTLRLSEDKKGLLWENDPPDTQWARDLLVTINRGDVNQMSFGFRAVREKWDNDKNERQLLEVELFDVGPVTFPAYPTTDVSVRTIFEEAGLDFMGLTKVMRMARYGLDIDERGQKLLQNSIEALGEIVAPLQGEHPTEEPIPRLSLLKRRLEIIEREEEIR